MKDTLNENIIDIQKKDYVTPELVEYGTLSEVTKSGGTCGNLDLDFELNSTICT